MNQGVPDTIRYTLPGSTRHYTIYSTRDYQTILDIIYNQAVPDPNEYMGGIALMVISPKKWEFLPFFISKLGIIQPYLKSFNDFN